MQLIQLILNSSNANFMYTDSQRLGYKINPLDHRYHKKVHDSLAESRGSFEGIETPGWSSLMKSQISDNMKKPQATERSEQPLKESDIYNKLTKLDRVKIKPAIEQPSLSYKQNETVDTFKTKNRGNESSRAKHGVSNSTNRLKHSQSSQKVGKQGEKRWNQITVHDHLYLESHKLESKRMIEKLLDEDFKKKEIFKFQPTINPKSIQLAEVKYSRIKSRIEEQKQFESDRQNTATSNQIEKQSREVERYRVLNKTFYFLSQGNTLLEESSLSKSLEELPLPCINVLQPILTQLYQGRKLEWVDFLEQFNQKVKQKQSFFSVILKWFGRRQKALQQ